MVKSLFQGKRGITLLSAHQYRILLLYPLALVIVSLLPWLGESIWEAKTVSAISVNSTQGAGALGLAPNVIQIDITPTGFDPTVVTITVGTQVTWHNATPATQTLQVDHPTYSILLPLILRETGGGARPVISTRTPSPRRPDSPQASLVFTTDLPPGGTFTHLFDAVGDYPEWLTNAPQFNLQAFCLQRVSVLVSQEVAMRNWLQVSDRVEAIQIYGAPGHSTRFRASLAGTFL